MQRFEILPFNASFNEINKDILLAYLTPSLNFLDLYALSRVEKCLMPIIWSDPNEHQIIVKYADNTQRRISGTYAEILETLQSEFKSSKESRSKNDEYRQHISSLRCKLNRYEFCSHYVCVNFNCLSKATQNCCIEVSSTVVGSAMCLTVFGTGVFGLMPLSAFCLKPCAIATVSGIGSGGVNYALMKTWMSISNICHSIFNQKLEGLTDQITELNSKIDHHVPKAIRMRK